MLLRRCVVFAFFTLASVAAPEALAAVSQVSLGQDHSCALFDDGRVKCWGDNSFGQLGLGDANARGKVAGQMGAALPYLDLGTNAIVKQLAAGSAHTCALLQSGAIKCWGNNSFGQLGYGDVALRGVAPGQMGDALPLVDLGNGQRGVSIAVGESHSCAVLQSGGVKCWGLNAMGQLGLDDTSARGDAAGEMGDALAVINLGSTVTKVVAGASHTCALTASRTVKCWGDGRYGQVGSGVADVVGDNAGEMAATQPVDLGAGRTAVNISAGFVHTCAQLDDRSLKCWGYNRDGRLGLGDSEHRGDSADEMGAALTAVNIAPGQFAEQLACGLRHCCVRLTNNAMKCWGLNRHGTLGVQDEIARAANPGLMGHELPFVDFGRLAIVSDFAAGGGHNCALLQGGTLKCWGANTSGQLGLGDVLPRGNTRGSMGAPLPAVSL